MAVKSTTAVLVVCHDAAATLPLTMASLAGQSRRPDWIVLVDNGSSPSVYLDTYRKQENVLVVCRENRGFAAANNTGVQALPDDPRYLLFLNPDALLEERYIENAVRAMNRPEQQHTGALCGRTFWYDMSRNQKTDRLDSTGIFRSWYGRWYNRGQGEKARGRFETPEDIPAACGSVLFCRKKSLDAVVVDGMVFDERFFLYKEDIELCIRLRKQGWGIRFDPHLVAWHCRGWAEKRCRMSRERRLMAARNEVFLYRLHPSPYFVWALAKYLAVRFLNI